MIQWARNLKEAQVFYFRNGKELAAPLIPASPSATRVRVDCPYCGCEHQIITVHLPQECQCGGQYHCEYPYDAHSQIYDQGFPRKAPAWWRADGITATMAEVK